MKKRYAFLSLILFCTVISFSSCSDSSTDPTPGGGSDKKTTIAGVVLNESNQPVAGATVSMPGQADKMGIIVKKCCWNLYK